MSSIHAPRLILFLLGSGLLLALAVAGLFVRGPLAGSLGVLSAPEVVQFAPRGSEIAPRSPITVTFAVPMDRGSVERAFSLGPAVDGAFGWEDDRTLVFTPAAALPLSATVQVHIKREASSWLTRPMEHDFASTFRTLGAPRVVESVPAPAARFAYLPDRLTITFSREMDQASVMSRLDITPDVPGAKYEWNGNELDIRAPFEPLQEYRIQISPGARDIAYGLPIQENLAWSFQSTRLYPFMYFTTPGRTGVVPASVETGIKVQYVDVSALNASLYKLDTPLGIKLLLGTDSMSELARPPPLRTWSVDLRSQADHLAETRVELGALDPGFYYLVLDAPEGVSLSRILVATRTALTLKRAGDAVLVWAVDMQRGTPVAGMQLTFLSSEGEQVGAGLTDGQGIYQGQLDCRGGHCADSVHVLGTSSDGISWVSDDWQLGIEPWRWPPQLEESSPSSSSVHVDAASPIGYKGQPASFLIESEDAEGNPTARQKLSYRLVQTDWDCAAHWDELGRRLYRCDPADTPVRAGSLTTDANGSGGVTFTPGKGGEYRLTVQSADSATRPLSATASIWVSAPDERVAWKYEEGNRAGLYAEMDSAGSAAHVLVESPYPNATALVTVERSGIMARRVITLASNSSVFEISLPQVGSPSAYIGLVLYPLNPAQPSFRIGYSLIATGRPSATDPSPPVPATSSQTLAVWVADP